MTETAAPPISRNKKVAFSVLLAILVSGALEVGARQVLRWKQGYDGEHLLQYEFDPYKNILPTRNYRDVRGVVHNAQGFRRSVDVPLRKPAGTYRIFLMGGSTAYGTGGLWTHLQNDYAVLQNSETIDAYLEANLADLFPEGNVEVINAAIPSVWTHHHLIYLNQSILRYDPDMVVFLDGFNDHYFFLPEHDQFARYTYGEHSTTIMGPPSLRALLAANGWWLMRKSAFAHLVMRTGRDVRTLLQRPPQQEPIDVERALKQLELTFADNALTMIERNSMIVQHGGARPVFLLQPMLIMERERTGMPEVERRMLEFNVESMLPNYEPFMRRAVPMVAAMTAASIERVGGTFLDLTGIYANADSQIFTDYCHLTPFANRILADYVSDRIAPLIAEDMRSDPAAESVPSPWEAED